MFSEFLLNKAKIIFSSLLAGIILCVTAQNTLAYCPKICCCILRTTSGAGHILLLTDNMNKMTIYMRYSLRVNDGEGLKKNTTPSAESSVSRSRRSNSTSKSSSRLVLACGHFYCLGPHPFELIECAKQ